MNDREFLMSLYNALADTKVVNLQAEKMVRLKAIAESLPDQETIPGEIMTVEVPEIVEILRSLEDNDVQVKYKLHGEEFKMAVPVPNAVYYDDGAMQTYVRGYIAANHKKYYAWIEKEVKHGNTS